MHNEVISGSRPVPPRDAVSLGLFYFFTYASVGFAVPFLPLYLRDRGYGMSEIGQLMASYAAAGGLTQVLIGAASDRLKNRKGPILAASLLCALAYGLFPIVRGFAGIALLYALAGIGFFGAATAAAALITDLTFHAHSTARGFGNARMWGSVGFILGLGVITAIPTVARSAALPYIVSALCAAAGISIIPADETRTGSDRCAATFLGGLSDVLQARMMVFLAAFLLFRTAESGTYSFLSLYLKTLGADEALIAIAYAMNAVVEIPFIVFVAPISDRIGRRPLLLLAFLALPGRLIAYSLLVKPASVLWIQLFHGLTFGIMVVLSVAYVADLSHARFRATAQALLSSAAAASMTAGPYLSGFLAEQLSLSGMYAVCAGIAALGAITFLTFGRESLSFRANCPR